MTFGNLPQIARFIQKTHASFAGTFPDKALGILGEMNAAMVEFPAMTGATFEAFTDMSHGELNTLVTITRVPAGGWEYVETISE